MFRANSILLLSFFHAMLCTNFLSLIALETDINCLKSIKHSFEDPGGNLASWVFDDIISDESSICRFKGVECWLPAASTVIRIELPGMGLKGQFPHGVEDCRSLENFNLSGNELHGSIPADIGFIMPSIHSLDLSPNKFSGEIPSSLGHCSYLDLLKLDNNNFTGEIPREISLGAQIRITKKCFENNRGLCGWPLGSCRHHMWSEHSFRKGVVIGYAVSLLATIVVFLRYDHLLSWMHLETMSRMMKTWRRNIKMKKQIHHRDTKLFTADNLQQGGKEIHRLEKMVARFPCTDLRNATNNFHERNMIGMGNMGIVFKARLPSGNFLAVKKLHYQQVLDEQFISELNTLGTLTHTNLLPLVGFCINSKERLLVYKYMLNGRLYDWLNPVKGNSKVMDWGVRVKEDEYSFGAVLLELITGEDSTCRMSSSNDSPNEWISNLMERNFSTSHGVIDKSIMEQQIGDEIHRFLEIAYKCVHSDPEHRPTQCNKCISRSPLLERDLKHQFLTINANLLKLKYLKPS